MNKALIIKLGYTETLDNSLSLTTSLGDVLRTTFILHFFKDYEVSWLVDAKAAPLLEGNPYISRIFSYDKISLEKLRKEEYDTVVNFEKLPEVCELVNSLDCKNAFGFGFKIRYKDQDSNPSNRLISLSRDTANRRRNKECWQKVLSESLAKEWNGEEYILGYSPRSEVIYDVGFNWQTSAKWPNKPWPKYCWEELENLLAGRYSISWQQGLNSLYDYIDWINSCRLIVTADSLGLHLSLVLKKRIVALFGPTSHTEIHFYGCGSVILPEVPYDCIPCLKPVCTKPKLCMEYIRPQTVKEKIDEEFKSGLSSSKI